MALFSFRTICVSTLGLTGSAAFCVASAAEAELEEVVVTAQKRSENVQDVPIAIAAYTAEELREKGITNVAQLGNQTPNVTFDGGTPFSGSTSVLAAYVRGIGQNDFAFNLDPGVGVYVDGVYLARTVGANADLGDVERVEVLKGPQGTLFGRNSIGGAISIVTREPGKELAFNADLSVGSFNRRDLKATVDLPFSDRVRSLLSFSSKNRDGFLKRIPYSDAAFGPFVTDGNQFRLPQLGTSPDEGGQSSQTVRAKLLIEATDSVRLTLTGDYTDEDQSASATKAIAYITTQDSAFAAQQLPFLTGGPNAGTVSGATFADIYNSCISHTPTELAGQTVLAPFPPFSTTFASVCADRGVVTSAVNPLGRANVSSSLAGVNVDSDPGNNRLPLDSRFLLADKDRSYATGISQSIMQSYGGAATLQIDLPDGMQLKSITAYRQLHWSAGQDLDGSPMEMLELGFVMNQHQVSQELQITGTAAGDRLNYVAGAYYFEESGDLHDYVTFPAGLLQVDGNNLLSTEAWAAFTHLNFRATDKIGLTLGARYTDERKTFEGFQSDLNGFNYKVANIPISLLSGIPCDASGPVPPTDACDFATLVGFPDPNNNILRYHPPGQLRKSFSQVTPRVGAEYHFTDDVMAYTSYSKGFKTGSWTTRYSNPVTLAQAAPGFQPEKADSYELGAKSVLLNRRLQVNAAAFYTDYTDIQLNQQEGVSPTIRNAGNAELYGAELEVQTVLSDRFLLASGLGYIHAAYTDVSAAAAAVGVTENNKLPKTPEWKYTLSPRYELPLPNSAALLFNAEYTYTSSLFNDTENTVYGRRDAVNMVNASVSYQVADDRWRITVGGTNLLNERYVVTGGVNRAAGLAFASYNAPVEWYATVGVRF